MKLVALPLLLIVSACASDTTDFRATALENGNFELALPQSVASSTIPSQLIDELVDNWGKKLCGKAYHISGGGIRKRGGQKYSEKIWQIDCQGTR